MQSESSSKGKGTTPNMFDPKELYSSWQDLSDEEQVEIFMSKT